MLWINALHLWVALAATCFLMSAHLLSRWFSTQTRSHSQAFASFSGGVAVAYVFLHMLPNLVESNKPIGEFLNQNQWLTAFTELFIYIIALGGFIIYYGLDLMAERAKTNRHTDQLVYALHLGMFCLYNFLITYTMSLRAYYSITATLIFTAAMALHCILMDRKFTHHYSRRFTHFGRYLLILGLFVGWLCSVIFDPVNVLISAFMVAFLSGSVLLNVFREELPKAQFVHYFWFSVGAILIALILLLHTWIRLNSF